MMTKSAAHSAAVITAIVSFTTAIISRRRAARAAVWLGALTACAMLSGLTVPARAETLSISATGLVLRCPCTGDNTDSAEENHGVFIGEKPNGRYFIPVVFPVTTGQKICSFSMAYEDTNANDTITARLYRKTYTEGGNPLLAPTIIATVKSASGVSATARTAKSAKINMPTITTVRSFYYIEADVVTVNLNIIGFEIVYKPSCP
ncbi:MAG TPA: hypothetical protein VG986_22995 [Pseudolabrys sp.]|nr:hypothetical protein [Pseudolabrys sp.]